MRIQRLGNVVVGVVITVVFLLLLTTTIADIWSDDEKIHTFGNVFNNLMEPPMKRLTYLS